MTDDAKAKAMGERGRNLVFEKYNWEREGEELVKVYEKLFQNVNKIN
jgi:glycosyltransferase involved in cell wall biosynthesis